MPPVVAVLVAYVLGSTPTAYIAGRWKGLDLRKHGSGNLGATNVMRVLGARTGALVFLFDMGKGAVPVLFFPAWTSGGHPSLFISIACGVAAIAGHVRPVFLKFGQGGKGVATAAGVFVGLAPLQTLLTLVVFAVVVLTSGYVSLGSLISAGTLPLLLLISFGAASSLLWISLAVAAFVFWTHRANVERLRRGEEHRFGKKGVPGKRAAATLAISLVVLIAMLVATRFG